MPRNSVEHFGENRDATLCVVNTLLTQLEAKSDCLSVGAYTLICVDKRRFVFSFALYSAGRVWASMLADCAARDAIDKVLERAHTFRIAYVRFELL